MLIIGLTGGIGSGKSAVAALFAELGVPVIDADIVARQVVEPGQPALAEIRQTFGKQVIGADGRLDRARLRDIVFADAARRKQLEALLHPRIRAEMQAQAQHLDAPYCLFAIPLLIESGQAESVDRVLVVDCPDALRRQRIKQRDALDDARIDAIFQAQLGREARLARADDIIHNDAGLAQLKHQVEALHRRYSALAGADKIREN